MSAELCYSVFNVRGNFAGNCGYSGGTFDACVQKDVLCGQLHCDSGNFINNENRAVTIIRNAVRGNQCVSFTSGPESDTPSPGLVDDGSKCGDEKAINFVNDMDF